MKEERMKKKSRKKTNATWKNDIKEDVVKEKN